MARNNRSTHSMMSVSKFVGTARALSVAKLQSRTAARPTRDWRLSTLCLAVLSCLAWGAQAAASDATNPASSAANRADTTMANSAAAPNQAATTATADDFERIQVTGSISGKRSVMQSSVSVSSVTTDDIKVAAPRSTAEIFRALPGVRSESTGGEGNANIAVRGLPVAAGGAKFLTLQEDGLPVLQFGDIAFGNADIFVRADSTIDRLDIIRGGSASTAASNSPGGIINFISKTGDYDGGSAAVTLGLDYDSYRTDFEYGGALNDATRFHVGGFVRQGDGVRDPGFSGEKGGQIKANITREFDKGYVRLYFKHLDDKATSYMPMPMRADGSSVPGFDAQRDTLQSAYLLSTLRLNGQNQISTGDVRDGMNPQVQSLGFEAVMDVLDGWSLENRFRISDISGAFITPFPAEIGGSQGIAESIAGKGATLSYANGARAGQAFRDANVMRIHMFDVEIDDFGSLVNDLRLSNTINNIDITAGFYRASQQIGMSWLWNSYLMELKGDNAALINVAAANGTKYSEQGLYAYGVPAWGNCCQRNYNTAYDINAPYLELATNYGDWNFDVSVRQDHGDARGTYAGAAISARDMNGDGVISLPEQQVAAIDLANPQLVNYGWRYSSYSGGANYQLDKNLALFGRISKGGRANADRLLFGKVRADGSVAAEDAVDIVKQMELGAKWRSDQFSLFATAFSAETEEQNFEATSQRFFDRVYQAKGLELESSYRLAQWELRGNLTWTDAEISKDALSPAVVGNTPRRQADVIYALSAKYFFAKAQLGVSVLGTTDAYAQDDNQLKFDGYQQVNAWLAYDVSDAMQLSLSANNLFDAIGITEAEEGVVPASGIIRARGLNGRSTSVNLRYSF